MSGVEPDTGSAIVCGRCYYLPRHVYACRTDDGVVFLNARQDRYFGLGGAAIAALPEFVSNWPVGRAGADKRNETKQSHEEVQRAADTLVERGLLCRGPKEDTPAKRMSVPPLAMDLPRHAAEARRQLHAIDCIYFAIAYIRALWLLKRQPLELIASRISAARVEGGAVDLAEIFGLVRVFRGLRRLFFSEKDRCLLNALALVLFLRRYGYFPLFVIGVKTRPFAAHSWVQHEQILLEGDPASICHFVPILVA